MLSQPQSTASTTAAAGASSNQVSHQESTSTNFVRDGSTALSSSSSVAATPLANESQIQPNFSMVLDSATLATIETRLGYSFQNRSLLSQAFTHPSYYEGRPSAATANHYERLEFLGDSALGLIVSNYLYHHYPNKPEGDLTEMRSFLVDSLACAKYLQQLQLDKYIQLGIGERANEGKGRMTIEGDVFEALIGAIYLDGGTHSAELVFLTRFESTLPQLISSRPRNWKSELQIYSLRRSPSAPTYRVDSSDGPSHRPTFRVSVWLNETKVGEGEGPSKKVAEQEAAKNVLSQLHQADGATSDDHPTIVNNGVLATVPAPFLVGIEPNPGPVSIWSTMPRDWLEEITTFLTLNELIHLFGCTCHNWLKVLQTIKSRQCDLSYYMLGQNRKPSKHVDGIVKRQLFDLFLTSPYRRHISCIFLYSSASVDSKLMDGITLQLPHLKRLFGLDLLCGHPLYSSVDTVVDHSRITFPPLLEVLDLRLIAPHPPIMDYWSHATQILSRLTDQQPTCLTRLELTFGGGDVVPTTAFDRLPKSLRSLNILGQGSNFFLSLEHFHAFRRLPYLRILIIGDYEYPHYVSHEQLLALTEPLKDETKRSELIQFFAQFNYQSAVELIGRLDSLQVCSINLSGHDVSDLSSLGELLCLNDLSLYCSAEVRFEALLTGLKSLHNRAHRLVDLKLFHPALSSGQLTELMPFLQYVHDLFLGDMGPCESFDFLLTPTTTVMEWTQFHFEFHLNDPFRITRPYSQLFSHLRFPHLQHVQIFGEHELNFNWDEEIINPKSPRFRLDLWPNLRAFYIDLPPNDQHQPSPSAQPTAPAPASLPQFVADDGVSQQPPPQPLIGIELNPGPQSSETASFSGKSLLHSGSTLIDGYFVPNNLFRPPKADSLFKDGLYCVFAYLNLSDWISAMGTCHYWYDTVATGPSRQWSFPIHFDSSGDFRSLPPPRLQTHFTSIEHPHSIPPSSLTGSQFRLLLQALPFTTSLSIRFCEVDLLRKDLDILTSQPMKQLTRVHLYQFPHLPNVMQFLYQLPSLKILHINMSLVTGSDLQVYQPIQDLPCLTDLELTGVYNLVRSPDWNYLPLTLTSIMLNGGHKFCLDVIKKLQRPLTNLRYCDMSSFTLHENDLIQFARVMPALESFNPLAFYVPDFHHLTLFQNLISIHFPTPPYVQADQDKSMRDAILVSTLAQCHKLTSLTFAYWSRPIQQPYWIQLAQSTIGQQLTELNFTHIHPNDVPAICEIFPLFPMIERVHLSGHFNRPTLDQLKTPFTSRLKFPHLSLLVIQSSTFPDVRFVKKCASRRPFMTRDQPLSPAVAEPPLSDFVDHNPALASPPIAVPSPRLVGIELNPGPLVSLIEPNLSPITRLKSTATPATATATAAAVTLFVDGLLTIFSFLSFPHLLPALHSCRGWYACGLKERCRHLTLNVLFHRSQHLHRFLTSPFRFHVTHLQHLSLHHILIMDQLPHVHTLTCTYQAQQGLMSARPYVPPKTHLEATPTTNIPICYELLQSFRLSNSITQLNLSLRISNEKDCPRVLCQSLISLLPSNPSLSAFSLDQWGGNTNNHFDLSSLRSLPALTSLKVISHSLEPYFQLFASLRLKHAELNPFIQPDWSLFHSTSPFMTQIEELNLGSSRLEEIDWIYLLAHLPTQLHTLTGTTWPTARYRAISEQTDIEPIQMNPNRLSHLSLNVENPRIGTIPSVIHCYCPDLTTLILHKSRLNDAALCTLLLGLSHLVELQILWNIHQEFSQSLQYLPRSVQFHYVQSDSFDTFASNLRQSKRLEIFKVNALFLQPPAATPPKLSNSNQLLGDRRREFQLLCQQMAQLQQCQIETLDQQSFQFKYGKSINLHTPPNPQTVPSPRLVGIESNPGPTSSLTEADSNPIQSHTTTQNSHINDNQVTIDSNSPSSDQSLTLRHFSCTQVLHSHISLVFPFQTFVEESFTRRTNHTIYAIKIGAMNSYRPLHYHCKHFVKPWCDFYTRTHQPPHPTTTKQSPHLDRLSSPMLQYLTRIQTGHADQSELRWICQRCTHLSELSIRYMPACSQPMNSEWIWPSTLTKITLDWNVEYESAVHEASLADQVLGISTHCTNLVEANIRINTVSGRVRVFNVASFFHSLTRLIHLERLKLVLIVYSGSDIPAETFLNDAYWSRLTPFHHPTLNHLDLEIIPFSLQQRLVTYLTSSSAALPSLTSLRGRFKEPFDLTCLQSFIHLHSINLGVRGGLGYDCVPWNEWIGGRVLFKLTQLESIYFEGEGHDNIHNLDPKLTLDLRTFTGLRSLSFNFSHGNLDDANFQFLEDLVLLENFYLSDNSRLISNSVVKQLSQYLTTNVTSVSIGPLVQNHLVHQFLQTRPNLSECKLMEFKSTSFDWIDHLPRPNLLLTLMIDFHRSNELLPPDSWIKLKKLTNLRSLTLIPPDSPFFRVLPFIPAHVIPNLFFHTSTISVNERWLKELRKYSYTLPPKIRVSYDRDAVVCECRDLKDDDAGENSETSPSSSSTSLPPPSVTVPQSRLVGIELNPGPRNNSFLFLHACGSGDGEEDEFTRTRCH